MDDEEKNSCEMTTRNKIWLENIQNELPESYYAEWNTDNDRSQIRLKTKETMEDKEQFKMIEKWIKGISVIANTKPIINEKYVRINIKLCNLCNSGDLGDEFHYLFNCKHFESEINLYIPKFYCVQPNTLKMLNLFESRNKKNSLT